MLPSPAFMPSALVAHVTLPQGRHVSVKRPSFAGAESALVEIHPQQPAHSQHAVRFWVHGAKQLDALPGHKKKDKDQVVTGPLRQDLENVRILLPVDTNFLERDAAIEDGTGGVRLQSDAKNSEAQAVAELFRELLEPGSGIEGGVGFPAWGGGPHQPPVHTDQVAAVAKRRSSASSGRGETAQGPDPSADAVGVAVTGFQRLPPRKLIEDVQAGDELLLPYDLVEQDAPGKPPKLTPKMANEPLGSAVPCEVFSVQKGRRFFGQTAAQGSRVSHCR